MTHRAAASVRRDPWFDNAKAILIVLVVFGHFAETFRDTNTGVHLIYNAIYLFHMPAMIFILGMFCRPPKSAADWRKIAYQSLVLYMFVQAVFIFAIPLMRDGALPDITLTLDQWFRPQFGLWFLLAMGAWRASLAVIPRAWWVVPIACIMALAAGYFDTINRLFSLSRILVFLPFFLAGYCFGDKISNGLRKLPPLYGGALLCGAIALGTAVFAPTVATQMMQAAVPYSKMGLGLPGFWRAVYFVLASGAVAGVLILSPKHTVFYSFVGQRTLYVYLSHLLVARGTHYLIFKDPLSIGVVCAIFCLTFLSVWAFSHPRCVSILRPLFEPQFLNAQGRNNP